MANLAIKGHPARGKEVIELLEMLGGKNIYNLTGTKEIWYILSNGTIEHSVYLFEEKNFSLEEFLKKYPYKVGDKVCFSDAPNHYLTIKKIWWNKDCNDLECTFHEDAIDVPVKDLQPYKEENMEERMYADLRLDVDQDGKLATEATIDGDKITAPENYLIGKVTKVDNGVLVEFVKKQPRYQKTYKECCDALGLKTLDNDAQGYKAYLIISFQELLIARDAYWKIAGEQIGLGKPWKYDMSKDEFSYAISYQYGYIQKCEVRYKNHFLSFPTAEMRDFFFENFKDLIEECKEFL